MKLKSANSEYIRYSDIYTYIYYIVLVKEGYYKIRGGGEAAAGWRGRRIERQRGGDYK